MISCALQTLNEEAFEDVLDEVEEELESSTSAGIRTTSNESGKRSWPEISSLEPFKGENNYATTSQYKSFIIA